MISILAGVDLSQPGAGYLVGALVTLASGLVVLLAPRVDDGRST